MNFEFTEHGWEDFQYWIETDNSIAEKIKDLLNEIKKHHSRELVNLNHSDTI